MPICPNLPPALNTGFKNEMSPTGWQNKSQIDIDGNGRIEWLTKLDDGSEADIVDSSALPLHQWHHLAAVHYDNNTAQLYANGALLGTTTPFFSRQVVWLWRKSRQQPRDPDLEGLHRRGQGLWETLQLQ